ncbi:hypothetical protein [Variovorax sp. LT1R16]|uniref:hypothetical protein n=1 Tax=Variovorax sp. LT1R16 TaxID=3443728 RepID=UPI003F488A74
MTYTVTLVDYPDDLSDEERQDAEARYRRAFEAKLGGAMNVPHCYRAFTHAADADQLGKADAEAAAAYMVARHLGVQAGFQGLGYSHEAFFEVRLA